MHGSMNIKFIFTCLGHHQPFKSSTTGHISITNQLQLQRNRNSHI